MIEELFQTETRKDERTEGHNDVIVFSKSLLDLVKHEIFKNRFPRVLGTFFYKRFGLEEKKRL
jgi:hypothetical protein